MSVTELLVEFEFHVPVQAQHLGKDEDQHHRHEDLGFIYVCSYTLRISLVEFKQQDCSKHALNPQHSR